MKRFRFLSALVFLAAPVAYADAIYNYAGAPFDSETGTPLYLANPRFTIGERIDVTVDLSTALSPSLVDQSVIPTSWSMDVGGTDYTSGEAEVTLTSALFSTDSAGNIDNWLFAVFVSPDVALSTAGSPHPGFLAGDDASLLGTEIAGGAFTGSIGVWTAQAAVPEPATLRLLIPGLAALFFLARRISHA
jgi:hypothetical protein